MREEDESPPPGAHSVNGARRQSHVELSGQDDEDDDELVVQPVVVHEAAMTCDSVSSL
jgi:hypothetical protein